jgi:hypothetical protein
MGKYRDMGIPARVAKKKSCTRGNSYVPKFAHTGMLYSLDETMTKVMAKEEVFVLYVGQAKRFQLNEKINLEINLYSDKEEIKNEDVESGISEDEQ